MTHLVLIPSYNSGPALRRTVEGALQAWQPVWVVVDGSTDGSADTLAPHPALRVLRLEQNGGKGAAVLHGLRQAEADGHTHALVLDADGQHDPGSIGRFMAASLASPGALVLGVPVFGPDAPMLRVRGRRISNWWAGLETGWALRDSLFGFRVYPIAPLRAVMERTRWMRRYDFDAEAAVRLVWRGLPVLHMAAPVTYPSVADGGVSHFRYGRDNVLLTGMHTRLVLGAILRLPLLLARRMRPAPPP